MENSEKLNCCSPNEENNTNCCPTNDAVVENSDQDFKKRFGLFILSLAFILAISSAFKIANSEGCTPSTCDPSKSCTSAASTNCCTSKK